jgi:hypothetical protein
MTAPWLKIQKTTRCRVVLVSAGVVTFALATLLSPLSASQQQVLGPQ